MNETRVNLIIGISLEHGLEVFVAHDGYINSRKFTDAFAECGKKAGRYAIFGDGVNYHNSKEAQKVYKKRKTFFITNVYYNPETSPVERYISILKRNYGKIRLAAIISNTQRTVRSMLDEAKNQIDRGSIDNICELGLRQM